MTEQIKYLGIFSDWLDAARHQQPLWPEALPGPATQQRVKECLGFYRGSEQPDDVRIERTWERDGLVGEEISWSVGYGPRTYAWLLKPAGANEPLPAVVTLHDHGGFKFYGKEKIAAGPDPVTPVMAQYHQTAYGGQAYANELAKQGFAVLVPDTFLWGSRRFPLEEMPDWIKRTVNASQATWHTEAVGVEDTPLEVAQYNEAARFQELVIEKFCTLLGTTLSGMISHEDRIAVHYLQSRPDVISTRIGSLGLSGGGLRSALLQATCDEISAAVVVGMMCTYEHLLYQHVDNHTWMLYPSDWPRHGEWPDLAACRAPSPLLVQYDIDDELFPIDGMRAAHARLEKHYRHAGNVENYTGEFYPGPHKFDVEMQKSAFAWLKRMLAQ